MQHKTAVVFVLGATLVATTPAVVRAQDQRVHVTLGGGFTSPNSEVRDRLGDGYNFNFGIEVAVTPILSIRVVANGLGSKRISIPVSPTVNPLDERSDRLLRRQNMQ
jgi:hypothetical protein